MAPAKGWLVKRMWNGAWQYYAGQNEALGAHRWVDDAKHAHVFVGRRKVAATLADAVGGFVVSEPRKLPESWKEADRILGASGSKSLGGGWMLRRLASSFEAAIQVYHRKKQIQRVLAPAGGELMAAMARAAIRKARGEEVR